MRNREFDCNLQSERNSNADSVSVRPLFVASADRIHVVDGVRFRGPDQLSIGNAMVNETSNCCWNSNWNASYYGNGYVHYDCEWKRAILRVARSVFH